MTIHDNMSDDAEVKEMNQEAPTTPEGVTTPEGEAPSGCPVMHGAAIAAPIWKGIMNKVLQDAPMVTFTEPPAKYLAADTTAGSAPVVPGQIPAVLGLCVPEVEAALQAAGFQTTIGVAIDSTVPIGLVAAISPFQSPPPGSLITIYPSRGSSQGAP